MDGLRLEEVSHRFGGLLVVDGVSLSVAPGELLCLLGPSGCGKTTTLRIAAGLEAVQQGLVTVNGREVARPGRQLPPEQRGIGMVFQDYALFPHLNVAENIAFGLRGLPAAARAAEAAKLLRRLNMDGYGKAYPHMLSGGEQQRVALARALAPRPAVMLMDEPFSNLDIRLRNAVREDTLGLLKEEGAATLLVTHDPEEAMQMADRIALMRAGQIVQVGTPEQIYARPASFFAAQFFSEINCMDGIVEEPGTVDTPLGAVPADGLPRGARVRVVCRPEAVHLAASIAAGAPATVLSARLLGPYGLVALRLQANGALLKSRINGAALPAPGDLVAVAVDMRETFVFPADNI